MRVFSTFLFNLFEMEETGGVWKTTVSWEFSMANIVSVSNKEKLWFPSSSLTLWRLSKALNYCAESAPFLCPCGIASQMKFIT